MKLHSSLVPSHTHTHTPAFDSGCSGPELVESSPHKAAILPGYRSENLVGIADWVLRFLLWTVSVGGLKTNRSRFEV